MNNMTKTILSVLGRIIQVILLFVLVIGIVATVVGSMLGISMVKVAEGAPTINSESIMLTLNENSKILDKDGNLIEAIAYDEYREIVEYKDIPKYLVDAFISIEDERFETHKGISLRSVVRSFMENVSAGNIVQGGSTITQQLIKNVYLSNEVSFDRKITEMYLAMQIETQLSKDQIMEAYLNRIFLGQHAYGVEAASQTYFSKPVSELTLAESATLASIAQSPSSYALFQAYTPSTVTEGAEEAGDFYVGGLNHVAVKNDTVMDRKDYVLDRMLELNKITQAEYNSAKSEDVMANVKPGSKLGKEVPSQIGSLIKNEAIQKIMESKNLSYEEARNVLYTGGLNIYTTIDWDVQSKLEETYDNFASLYGNQVSGGALLADLNRDTYGDIVDSNGNKLYYRKGNLLTSENKLYLPSGWYEITDEGDLIVNSSRFTQTDSGIYVKPYYTLTDADELVTYRVSSIDIPLQYISNNEGGGFRISADYFKNISDFYEIDEDNDLVINDRYYTLETQGTVQPQSSTAILDSKSGNIVGIIGGRGKSADDNINRATDYPRSPGSSMKPLSTYAPAVENGRRLSDPVDDVPYQMIDNTAWPRNVYNYYNGVVTTRDALKESMNGPAVQILAEIGIDTAKEYLTKFGIINEEHPEDDNFITRDEDSSNNDENLSLTLGGMTRGMTVLDMASAFQTFANDGERIPSTIISKIENKEEVLYENDHHGVRVISSETNFLITDTLKGVVDDDFHRGTGNPNGIDTAGKTGTTDNKSDFWFVGYNNYYTAATWVGFDDARISLTGYSTTASTLYGNYMNKILEGKEASAFVKPDSIVTAEVSKVDGLLPNPLTKSDPRGNMVYREYFKEGTVPTKQSDANVQVDVDKRNNLLATDRTPAFLKEKRTFVKRVFDYNPDNFGGIEPRDWKLQPPTKFSDLPWNEETKTERLSDGTIVETTTKFNGDVIVKQTKPDGTIIVQTTTIDGKVTTKVTRPETERETEQETQPETPPETPGETQTETPPETQGEQSPAAYYNRSNRRRAA